MCSCHSLLGLHTGFQFCSRYYLQLGKILLLELKFSMLCFTLREFIQFFPESFYFVKAKPLLLLSKQGCILTNTGLAVPATISPDSSLLHEEIGKTSSLPLATVPLFMFYLSWHAFPSFRFSDCDQLQGQPKFHLFHEIFLKASGPLDLPPFPSVPIDTDS